MEFYLDFSLPWVFQPVPFPPPCPPCYCFELPGNTYSAKGSSCKSFNSRPPAWVGRVSRCPLSSRYTLPPGDIRPSLVGGVCTPGLEGGSTVGPGLGKQSSSKVWGSSRASAHSRGVMCPFLQKGGGFSGASGGTSLEKQREIKK